MTRQKDAAAVSLGRRGGIARAKNITAERRKEIAQAGAKARWKRDVEKENVVEHKDNGQDC